ncbi:MAG: hypothetical protein WB998_03210 [Solirubrobacteraceae bacterium]
MLSKLRPIVAAWATVALASILTLWSSALWPSLVAGAEPQTTITATEGESFSGQVADIKSLVCPVEDLRHEQASIVWGDDPTTAGTVSVDQAGTGVSVSGTHTYLAAGTYEGSVKLDYECNQVQFSTTATFTADVKAPSQEPPPTEPTPTTPTTTAPAPTSPTSPPAQPAPPVVKATFGVVSVSPGRAVLDASASAPPGTSATSYSWNITGGSHPDAICQGSEPQLTVTTRGALNTTVNLTATDARGIESTTSVPLSITAPDLHVSHAAHFSAVHAGAPSVRRTVGTPVSPSFTVLGECSGTVLPALAPLTGAGARLVAKGVGLGVRPLGSIGAPPEECKQDVEFGAADVLGCLKEIGEPKELPGGITTELAGLLCGAHYKSFCTPALSAAAHAGASFLEEELGGDASAARTRSAKGATARQASVLEQQATAAVPTALKRMGFPSYYSWTAVRVDGLDIDPQNGQPILVIPSASIVVSADASIYLLGHQISPLHTVALYLPSAGGSLGEISLPHKLPLIGSLPFSGSISVALQRAGVTLANGDTCTFDCAAISVNAELPGVFSDGDGHGLSAGGVITADDRQGLQLDSLEVKIPHAEIAGIGVDKVDFRYRRADDSLRGEATLDLLASGEISARFAFVHGGFQEGHVAWSAGEGPGIDLGGPIPIFLTRLGGGITVNPAVLTAEGAIAGGGDVMGCSLFGISGTLTIQFAPFELNANAAGELLCNQVAEEYFHVDEAGDIGLGGNVHIEIYVLSFEAGIAFEVSQGHFQFDGNVNACLHLLGEHCLGAEVVVSDHGVGACADLGFTHAGAGIVFPDETHFMLDSCDIAQFRSLPMPANLASLHHFPSTDGLSPGVARHAPPARDPSAGAAGELTSPSGPPASTAQTLPSFTVPRGQSVAALGVLGTGGAPRVTLKGPDGRKIETPADGYLKDSSEVVIADGRKTMETYFFINHPSPGKWTIESDPGSAPVRGVDQAAGLPSPDLHAKLSRFGGGKERLRYSLRKSPGQRVTFVDAHKGHGFRVLGQAHGSKGAIVFSPSSDLGRRHEIVAWVTQDGHPREDLTLVHYTAPAPGPLPAPKGLKATRHDRTVTIRWKAVTGAAGYTLSVRLSNGVQQHYALGIRGEDRRRSLTLSLPSYLGAELSIAAQAPGRGHRAGRRADLRLGKGPKPRGVSIRPFVS